jgi:3-isopropylmalate/(R)-2-methylmalate dehydratase small subunit
VKELAVKGRVWKYGDNIDTDVIIPGKYMGFKTLAEQLPHTMEGVDPDFAQKVKAGDIVVAGRNFGCGSSRETAATLLKKIGLAAVMAESFSRIFFRNAINQGLLLVECKGIHDAVEEGDVVEYHSASGLVRVIGKDTELPSAALPDFLLEILLDGGAIPNFRKKHEKASAVSDRTR